jgi:hypothetical protein
MRCAGADREFQSRDIARPGVHLPHQKETAILETGSGKLTRGAPEPASRAA